MQPKRIPPGIVVRHSRGCPSRAGEACKCKPTFEAWVYSRRDQRKIRKSFPTIAAAKSWRADATSQLDRGTLARPTRQTLRVVADAWLEGVTAEPPSILNRSGQRYKPSVVRGYEADLRRFVIPALGDVRLSELRRGDVQALVDSLLGAGHSASKIHNVAVSLKAVCRHAVERELLTVNPTRDLRLPADHGRRDRAASPGEAQELLAALEEFDRPLWATACYAGLRLGELRALRWSDVDLANGVIRVERSWDAVAGAIEPKSKKGVRTVPLVAVLRDYLVEHKARTGRDGDELVFGATAERPFTPSYMRKRAARAWDAENARRLERKLKPLEPIGFHECRHTYVSLMVAAGNSLEEVGDYVGHSSVWMVDRYRHLLEGHEAEAARRLDAFLAAADTRGRIEQLDG